MDNNNKNSTETQLEVAITVLLDSLNDKSNIVIDTINESIQKLSKKHTNEILKTSCKYYRNLTTQQQTNQKQQLIILNIIERICNDNIIEIDGDTVRLINNFCLEIINNPIGNNSDDQMKASNILVALGHQHHIELMEILVRTLAPNQLPNRTILQTLSKFSIINPNGFVPYLERIFTILIPLLTNQNLMRNDDLKELFVQTIGNFCESINEYLINIETMTDPTITIDLYKHDINTSFDIVNHWLVQTTNKQLINQLLITLSKIVQIIDQDKLQKNYNRIFDFLLNCNQKKFLKSSNSIIKCLLALIQKTIEINGQLIEPMIPQLLILLNNYIIIDNNLDYEHDYLLLTQHNDVLRCYDCLTNYFTDTIIAHLLQQINNNNNNNNETNCLKSLIILTYLLQYSKITQQYLGRIVDNFNNFLALQQNPRINRQLLKIITILLLNKQITHVVIYLEFLIKLSDNCSGELKKLTDNTLFLLTTSGDQYAPLLWDLFVDNLLKNDLNLIILRCLINLSAKSHAARLTPDLFVKCLVLLADPLLEFRGQFVLNFLKNCQLDDNNRDVWIAQIQQLLKYLEQNYDNFNRHEWFELIYDFLNIFLASIKIDLIQQLLEISKRYLNRYNSNYFVIKLSGVFLCFIKDRAIIVDQLDYLLLNLDVHDFGVYSECLGLCSRQHQSIVLEKLTNYRHDYDLLKHKRFFRFTTNKQLSPIIATIKLSPDNLRQLLLSTFIEICNETQLTLELSRIIENDVLILVQTELQQCTTNCQLRELCIKTINAVADLMHPNRNRFLIRLQKRDDLIGLLKQEFQLHNGYDYIELFPLILQTLLALLRLPPLVQQPADLIDLLRLCFNNVINGAAIYHGNNKLAPIIAKSLVKLQQLVKELFVQNLTTNQFITITNLLWDWLNCKKPEQRLPSIEIVNLLLHAYYDHYKLVLNNDSNCFDEICGGLLGNLLRRLFDTNLKIRKFAINSIYLLLCIMKRNNGIIINLDYDKQLMNQLQLIEQQLLMDDSTNFQLLNNLLNELINIINVNLNNHQLIYCLNCLIVGLLDFDMLCSYCVAFSLNLLLKTKGMHLQTNTIETIIENLLKQLNDIKCLRTKQVTLKAILNFMVHHPRTISHLLLSQPLPYNSVLCECWAIISTDTTLVLDLIDQFKKTIKQSQFYTMDENKNIKIINIQIYQIINVLNELLKNQQLKDICRQDFSELFSLLLITIGSYIGAIVPTTLRTTLTIQQLVKIKPEKLAIDTLKQFLVCCEFKQMSNCLLVFTNFENDDHNDYNDYLLMIEKLIEQLFHENYNSLSWLVANFGPYIRSDSNIERITVVFFFGQLLKNKLINQQQILAENLLEILLDVNLDQCFLVRKLALDGLGNAIDTLNFDLIQRHYQPILSVLMNSLDYDNIGNESDVILAGMLTFTKLLTILKGEKFSTCQVTTVVRIKPLFDQDDEHLRNASIHLFGDLTLSLNNNHNNNNSDNNNGNIEAFREQIHNNLITLLLHLNDPNLDVIKSCKYTLRKICSYLENTPKFKQMIQEHLIEEATLHYVNFIKDIVKIMAEEMQDLFNLFIMTSLSYLKSEYSQIRSSACLIIGLLFINLLPEQRTRISLDIIYDKLVRLLNDEHEDVRMRAVQSIAYLFVD